MTQDKFMEVRAALTTTSNSDWSGTTTNGGAEINKEMQRRISIYRGINCFDG
jgi:hypothetical protein